MTNSTAHGSPTQNASAASNTPSAFSIHVHTTFVVLDTSHSIQYGHAANVTSPITAIPNGAQNTDSAQHWQLSQSVDSSSLDGSGVATGRSDTGTDSTFTSMEMLSVAEATSDGTSITFSIVVKMPTFHTNKSLM
jgi:hypothetical protein